MRYTNETGKQLQDPGERTRLHAAHQNARDERNQRDRRGLIQHVDDVRGLARGNAGANQEHRGEQDAHRVLAKEPFLVPRASPLRRDPA